MDFLKRNLAPVIDDAWANIEKEVKRALKANLSGRYVVDFDGPKGFDYSAVNLGRLSETEAIEGVNYGVRKVQPLVELRVPFELDIWELDNFARGADDVDLEPAVHAALKLAAFEERAIYEGFAPGAIVGLAELADHEPIALGGDPSRYPDAVAGATLKLQDSGIGGPYALVLGEEPFRHLSADVSHYPPRERIAKMIDGPILHSPILKCGFLISIRGGDFALTVGQDISMGYDHHDSKNVFLYLTESFTFRVLESEAVVKLNVG